jgi:hypothetical protein
MVRADPFGSHGHTVGYMVVNKDSNPASCPMKMFR